MITFTAGTRNRIEVEDCTIDGIHDVELEVRNGIATVTCPCCQGEGEHVHGHGPYTDTYSCDPCIGKGYFQVNL
jgi:hypothetical protein